MNSLNYNLYTKHPLRFGKDGKFKILQVSDFQENLNYDVRSLEGFNRLLDAEKPELVILGGDNCDGHRLQNGDELRAYLDIFAAPLEERHIPWAHVFGNHDHDLPMDDVEQTKIYESYSYCVSKHTVGIGGVTNFILPVLASDSDKIAYAVWGLDTGNRIDRCDIPHAGEVLDLPKRPYNSDCWDIIRFEQLMWYYTSSVELEKHCGEKVYGAMFMHISPWEFQLAVDNPEIAGTVGSTVERMNLGGFNSGLFATVLQRGDIRAISCGHSHEDCFEATLCGISVSLDACAGYSPYGIDELRGGRVFVIDEKDTSAVTTYMRHYKDL
ncbi:MAG: metallophosphoesterase [Clostridia bacterium]|nr:metallophosphoesterase [Clostridia bacterium]